MTTEAEWRTSVLPFTLHEEGGTSRDPHDAGNWTGGKCGKGKLVGTRFGIAAASHPTLDVLHLTIAQASDVYWREYVESRRFDTLPLPLLLVTFDAGVQCGTLHAARWLLEAEKEPTLKAQVAKLTALNLAYHRSLKTWSRYGKGWGDRIARCERQAMSLAAAGVALPVHAPVPTVNTPRAAPKAAHQPAASAWTLFWRGLADALFQPAPKGAHA